MKNSGKINNENVIQEKSYNFALEIVLTARRLTTVQKEYVISKQLLRSGTSIGANVEEAIGGQSQKDFRAKMSIAYKEARETHYWLRLIRDSDLLDEKSIQPLIKKCHELKSILGAILVTLNKNLSK